MAYRGNGRKVVIVGVRKDRAFREQLRNAADITGAKPGEIVIAELVDNDSHHKLGLFN